MKPAAPKGPPLEIELRLAIPPRAIPALLAHPAIARAKRGPARRRSVESLYFDTPDARLARDGVALRVRRAGRDWLQTVKGPADGASGGGLSARVEFESPLPARPRPRGIDHRALAATPYGPLIADAAVAGLAPMFATSFTRTDVPLTFADGTRAELAVDVGEVRATSGVRGDAPRTPISEVEIELVEGDPAQLFALALALADDVPLAVQSRSKAERGYALVRPASRSPVRAERLRLADDATIGTAIAAMLRSALRQVEANAAGLADGDEPEWVHQLRVGMRRLRSALALAKRLLPDGAAARLGQELQRLGAALGEARDLDVFVAETLPAITAETPPSRAEARALRALRSTAEARRDALRDDARRAVAEPDFHRLLLEAAALAAFVESPAAAAARALAQPARSVAARRMRRLHRRLADTTRDPAHLDSDKRHGLRIAAKKLRYAADGFASLFPSRRFALYRRALADVQAALGALNDGDVAFALATGLEAPGDIASAYVARSVTLRRNAQLDALVRAWRSFRKAGRPFAAD